jgi:hypothetical protein
METKEIKLSEQELIQINELRISIRENIDTIGNLNVRKHFLLKEISELDKDIENSLLETEHLNLSEKNKVKEIVEKYGEGRLDFETGIYYIS